MTVIIGWDRARAQAMSYGSVRLVDDADRRVLMTFLDTREKYGFWLGALVDEGEEDAAGELGAAVYANSRLAAGAPVLASA